MADTLLNTTFEDSQTVPAPPGVTFPIGPDGGGGMVEGAFLFTAPVAGVLDIAVQDCCLVGDVYEVILDGHSLGLTTPVQLNGPNPSTGEFFIPDTAGLHSLVIYDTILSYIGFQDPFGGGIVTSNFSPAGGSVQVTENIKFTPEPGTILLMGAGLLGLGITRFRKRLN